MDSTERRLQDAKLGAAIDDAIDRLPIGFKLQIGIAHGCYEVRLVHGYHLSKRFDGEPAHAIRDAVEWAENA